jgi:hypothetical protein
MLSRILFFIVSAYTLFISYTVYVLSSRRGPKKPDRVEGFFLIHDQRDISRVFAANNKQMGEVSFGNSGHIICYYCENKLITYPSDQ